jgi:hypothetical protein
MVDPKNFREVAIDLEAFKREVDPQFKHLNTMVNWILAVVVGAAASGGYAAWTLTGDIKANVAVLSERVRAVDERLKTLETGATPTQKQVVDALTRIEGKIVL